jgi:Caspase domain
MLHTNALVKKLLHRLGTATTSRLLCSCIVPLIVTGTVHAQSEPTLRIKSPFAGPIWRAAVDRDETIVSVASAYKAISTWSLDDPRNFKLTHLPLRREQMQRAHAIAVSPDGSLIATSVPPAIDAGDQIQIGTAKIYVIDTATNGIKYLLGREPTDLPTRPQVVRFSMDGQYLAAGLSDGCGLRVWRTNDWSLAASDDAGYGGGDVTVDRCCRPGAIESCDALPDTTGLVFGPEGSDVWIVTSGESGVRSYRRTETGLALIAHKSSADLQLCRPAGLSIAADGKTLAIGDRKEPETCPGQQVLPTAAVEPIDIRIALVNLLTLRPLPASPLRVEDQQSLATAVAPGASQAMLEHVAWLDVGERHYIYAGGALNCSWTRGDLVIGAITNENSAVCLARWDIANLDEGPRFIEAGNNRIMDLIALPKRTALLIATTNGVKLITPDGDPVDAGAFGPFVQTNKAVDFRNAELLYSVSADGRRVAFEDFSRGDGLRRTVLSFDLNHLSLTAIAPGTAYDRTKSELIAGLLAPNRNRSFVDDWQDTSRRHPLRKAPKIAGRTLPRAMLAHDEIHRSAAAIPSLGVVLLGSSNYIRVATPTTTGPIVLCQLAIVDEAFRVNITPDGTLAIVGHSDGTLRWYRVVRDGKSCSLSLLLSVLFWEVKTGDWTWLAWLPDGRFSNDPKEPGLAEWVLPRTDGRFDTVALAELVGKYDDAAVRGALAPSSRDLPTDSKDAAQRLALDLGTKVLPNRISVIYPVPHERQVATSENVSFRLQGEPNTGTANIGTHTVKLHARTGDGVRASLMYQGQRIDPQTPAEISADGTSDIEVILPERSRQTHGAVEIWLYPEGGKPVSRTIDWAGPPPKKRPRKLRALLVGLSDYKHNTLQLDFPQNDALDVAHLMVSDAERSKDLSGDRSSDFASVEIDLVVASTSPEVEVEVQALISNRAAVVRRHPATTIAVLDVLRRIADESRTGALANDLFVFLFAGHGAVNPFAQETGFTALLMPGIDPDINRENFAAQSLTSDKLFPLLDAIEAEKIILLDACRSPINPSDGTLHPFDPGQVNKELQRQLLSANVFFSGKAGQVSFEQTEFVFDRTRTTARRGNGLFTFALLDALTNPKADLPRGNQPPNGQIELDEIARYVGGIFNPSDPESIMRKVAALHPNQFKTLQEPDFLEARSGVTTQVRGLTRPMPVRTLKP